MTQDDSGERGDTPSPQRLRLRFWWLVLLAKLAVLVIGAGILVLAFTRNAFAGLAVILVGIVIVLRWIHLFRKSRRQLESDSRTDHTT